MTTPDQRPLSDRAIARILSPRASGFSSRSRRVANGFWRTLRKAAPHIPFIDELVAAYYCAMDPATPFRVRATLIAALFYFVVPLDVVPDIIAGFGFTDDVAVLTAALSALRGHIRPVHRRQAREALARLAAD